MDDKLRRLLLVELGRHYETDNAATPGDTISIQATIGKITQLFDCKICLFFDKYQYLR